MRKARVKARILQVNHKHISDIFAQLWSIPQIKNFSDASATKTPEENTERKKLPNAKILFPPLVSFSDEPETRTVVASDMK